jgi:peptide/nickel transport system permease protein
VKALRFSAVVFLLLLYVAALAADALAPASYETQFRESPRAGPSTRFPLGTDDLGRDRLSRLLYGTRVSLLLAPAAAFLSTMLAAAVGLTAGYLGGLWERASMALADLFNSLPWLFLLITVRAVLPLNVSPWASVTITFLLLGLLGWASGARVIRAGAVRMRESGFCLQARAAGIGHLRLMLVQILPNLRPLLRSQFWIAIPVFILAEANLGMLGLGVAEPLPSWGNLLAELENLHALGRAPWLLAPAALLILVVSSFYLAVAEEDRP